MGYIAPPLVQQTLDNGLNRARPIMAQHSGDR